MSSITRAGSLCGFVLAAAAAGSGAQAAVFTATGGPLADRTASGPTFAEVSFPLVVSGVGQNVQAINSVTWTTFTHTWAGDINVMLFAPDGTGHEIWGPPDNDSTNLNGTYVMVESTAIQSLDERSVPLGDNDVIPSGTYAISNFLNVNDPGPHGTFAPLLGKPADGTWILRIRDFGVGDSGALGSWSLDITPVPEPAALSTLVIGAALLARRRR